jgi:hypothetical protein
MKRLRIGVFTLAALSALFSFPSFAQLTVAPQGRLTLSSNTPVMTSDVSGAGTIYYTPYAGNNIPIYTSGTGWAEHTFSQLTLTLNSSEQTQGTIYDIFAFLNSGVVTIGVNCYAWGSPLSLITRGPAAAVQIEQLNGIWVNTNGSFCVYNGATSYNTIAANSATYLGTVYIPTVGGETTVQFKPTPASGGTANIIGIWNAYNRVPISSISRDSNTSWIDTHGTWVDADSSANNSISWVDGLQQTAVRARYSALAASNTSPSASAFYLGVNLDAGSGTTPNVFAALTTVSGPNFSEDVEESFPPQLGLHYVQAVEQVSGTSPSATFYGDGFQSLILQTEY